MALSKAHLVCDVPPYRQTREPEGLKHQREGGYSVIVFEDRCQSPCDSVTDHGCNLTYLVSYLLD
jgi:hypothetical protein